MKTHQLSQIPEYGTWKRMNQRCHNPNNPDFKHYGGRGLEVCPEWKPNFKAFYKHIGPKPHNKTSVERIDNNRGYEPGNVRWATQEEQTNNCRSNRCITFSGKTYTAAQWAKKLNVTSYMIRRRLDRGWSIEKTLNAPFQHSRIHAITFRGKTQSIQQWADDYGMKRGTFNARLNRGWSVKKSLNTPVHSIP